MQVKRKSHREIMKRKNLGQRLHNPLNIRYDARNKWKGLDTKAPSEGGFCRFISDEYGLRAAIVLLKTYITRYHLDTPQKIIERWAPPSENDTEIYVAIVCGRTLLKPDSRIEADSKALSHLVSAMALQETGLRFVPAYIMQVRSDFGV